MYYRKSIVIVLINFSFIFIGNAQKLRPGFDSSEYRQLLSLADIINTHDTLKLKELEPAHGLSLIYRSEPIGLDNLWELWMREDGVPVISIRGTTPKFESWLANYYVAMVPAKGSLTLSDSVVFDYKVAEMEEAAVHTGWLAGTGFLLQEILPKIDSLYKTGSREFIITGHSQGGAITFLMNAHLQYMQKDGKLPGDIRFKTYSSAAPKPGNLYFAYDYEGLNRDGWAFNVINTEDWVPETPLTMQTIDDFNEINPFKDAKQGIRRMKFPQDVVLLRVFRKLSNPAEKTRDNYIKFLGEKIFEQIANYLPGFAPPEYAETMNYARAGNTIVLNATEDYKKIYPQDKDNIFAHHLIEAYLFLMDVHYPEE